MRRIYPGLSRIENEIIKNVKEVEEFEKLEAQLHAFRREMAELSKKKPNDGVNKFKLRFLDQALAAANNILGGNQALEGFEQFNLDDVPSNSDVVFVLAQYTDGIIGCALVTRRRLAAPTTGLFAGRNCKFRLAIHIIVDIRSNQNASPWEAEADADIG